MLLFKVQTKNKQKDISLKAFLEEYQKITLNFLKEIKQLQNTNQKQMIEKLMGMAACATMPEYQPYMKQDILELLQMNQVYPMNTQVGDRFDPTRHSCRKALSNQEYVITKVYEDGFVSENEVLQKATVEVGGMKYE